MLLALLPWALFSIGVVALLARPAVTGRLKRRRAVPITPACTAPDLPPADEGRQL